MWRLAGWFKVKRLYIPFILGWLASVWLPEFRTSAVSALYFVVEGVLLPTPEPAEDVEPEFGTFAAVFVLFADHEGGGASKLFVFLLHVARRQVGRQCGVFLLFSQKYRVLRWRGGGFGQVLNAPEAA